MNFLHKKNNNALNIVKKRKIKILLNESKNNECFECSKMYPEYISLNNGIFICKECASNHSVLPKNISNIIKNNLSELTLRNIQYLSLGGNRKLTEFITMEFPNLKNFSPVYFYQTNAMDYYRRCLQYLIEGGARPVKPDRNKAYELVAQRCTQFCTKMLNNNNNYDGNYIKLSKNPIANGSNNKCENYIKINGNTIYPKIKPIVGTKNDCRFTRSLSRHLEKNELTNNTSNYKNLNNTSNDDYLNNGKITSPSSDFKGNYSQLKNNYDTDGNYFEMGDFNINEINEQFNNISGIKDEIKEINLISFNINNDSLKTKKKINKRNKEESSIRVFKINKTMTNNKSSSNTNSKERSIRQKYLENFNDDIKINISTRNDNLFNLNKYKSCANFKNERKHFINNIEDLRIYLNSTKNHRNQNEFNRKALKPKKNVNNINNNIIINRNLNVFYNNNRNNDYILKKVFKKKTIGDSFSIIEKKNNVNCSSEKNKFFMTANDEKNIFKLRKKHKNDIKKKLKDKIFEKSNENAFIKVNKLNNMKKNKTCLNDINNISFGNINFFGPNTLYNSNLQNNKENIQCNNNASNIFYYTSNYIINNIINNAINNSEYIINQKSELIHRISRVLKAQKEKKEKKKSFEKIRVNQKYNIRNIKRNINNNKLNFAREKILEQKENENEKEKEKERYRNKSYTEIKINESKNIEEHGGRNIIPIKDLINIPFGKKRRILEIFKKNNFANKSVSPDIKKLLRISSEPNITIKKEFNNTYTSTTNKFMKKKN